MAGWIVGGIGFLVGLALVIAYSNRMLCNADPSTSTGAADAFGGMLDVFDPAQGRARRDIQEQDSVGAVLPSPDGDDRPMLIIDDGERRIVRIRPPSQSSGPPPTTGPPTGPLTGPT